MRKFLIFTIMALVSCTPGRAPFKAESVTGVFGPAFGQNAATGLSGHFSFVSDGLLVVGGGCNFPGDPFAPSARKTFYGNVYVRDGVWKKAGELPGPLAYACTALFGGGVMLIGGSGPDGLSDKVFRLALKDGELVISDCPSLPMGLDQAAACTLGDRVFVAGGNDDVGASSHVLCFEDGRWDFFAEIPEALVQPVACATEEALFVFGGFNPSLSPKDAVSHGWRLEFASSKWTRIPYPSDSLTFTGSAGVMVDGRYLVFAGGVNRSVFNSEVNSPDPGYLLRPVEAYRFNPVLYCFDTRNQGWSELDSDRIYALAGASAAADGHHIMIAGGELKPRVRTPQVVDIQLK